jgi:type II secretion system protein N
MTRFQLTILACLAFVLLFVAGLATHFPGAAVARYVGRQVERGLGIPVQLSPIRLAWSGMAADRLEVRVPGSVPLIVQDMRLPWSWRWVLEAPLEARFGKEGRIEAAWGWGGEASLSASRVPLQDIPLGLPADVKVQGRVDVTARVGPQAPGRASVREMLPGRIELKAEGVEIRELHLAGTALPPLRLETVEGRIGLGRVVQLESLVFRGDAQGNLSGTITPNLDRPGDSRLNLNLTLLLQPTWLNQLGDLRTVAEGLLPGGRLDSAIEGSLAAPTLTRTKRP